jgi:hypothetical protein
VISWSSVPLLWITKTWSVGGEMFWQSKKFVLSWSQHLHSHFLASPTIPYISDQVPYEENQYSVSNYLHNRTCMLFNYSLFLSQVGTTCNGTHYLQA